MSDAPDPVPTGEAPARQGPYREPEVAPPPPPQPEIHWLGTLRFWLVAAGLSLLVGGWLLGRAVRAAQDDALVAVLSLSGPTEAAAGEKLRYGVLVRDRWGAAVPHARVRLGFGYHGFRELARGETGEDGTASIELTVPTDFVGPEPLAAIADVGVVESRSEMVLAARRPVTGRFIVSTDKPLYQPGQTVHIRALAMAGEKPVGGRATNIEIRTPEGIRVFHEARTTSEFGVVSADFALAEQVKLGSYAIRVSSPSREDLHDAGFEASATIDVKRYSLPKLKLALADVGSLQPGAPLQGVARATWIFGEPVTKGAVSVTLEQSGSAVRTATGQLDKDGTYRFALPPRPDAKPDQEARGSFTLRARVEVEGGLKAEASTSLETLRAGEIKLEAFPESGALVGLVEQTVLVLASGSAREDVEISTPGGTPVKTDAHGIARLLVRPTDPRVELRARGPKGESGSLTLSAKKEGLVVRADRDSYDAGTSARVRVVGATAGDRIVARMMKGNEPLLTGTCLVANAIEGCDIPFATPTSVSGLVWIQALSMPADRKREVLSGKRLVMVEGGGRDLTLKVSTDKPVYAPRDVGNVTVDVTGSGGKAVKAGVGVAIADEAVFALASVRPDLERLVFVVDQDVRGARDSSYSRGSSETPEASLPSGFEKQTAYDRAAPSSVRGLILAVLTTMPEAEPLTNRTSATLREHVRSLVGDEISRLGAWAVVSIAGLSVGALVMFAAYGVLRLRRRVPSAVSPSDRAIFLAETRGLLTDWLIAVIGPIGATPIAIACAGFFNARYSGEDQIAFGSWSVLALLGSWMLLRGALRVRRTAVAAESRTLGRAVLLLPAATFFGQLAVLLAVGDSGRKVRVLFDARESVFFIPLVVVLGAQLAFGFLSVIRQTLLRPVTRRGAIWLLLSRATFVGLPVTLGFLIYMGARVSRQHHRTYAEEDMDERELAAAAESASDNKEGGTGTRAKGEEGSMGSPKRDQSARYGVLGAIEREKDGAVGVRVRDWFPETLLWAPELVTDDAGRLSFKVPFADSITTWQLALRAVSAAGQIGSGVTPLVVKQDFFVDAALPATLTQGDELAVPVTVYSYLERAQDVSIDLEGDGMSAVGAGHVSMHLEPKEARGMRFTVRADRAGERVVRIKASTSARADVEERKVIVVPNGTEVQQTTNARLINAARSEVTLPAGAIDGGNDLYAKVYGGPLSQVGEGLDGVFRMPYGCFEQTSSTTYPSILVLDFLRRSKAVSPGVEKKARGYLGQGYQRLLSFEVKGGGFSLFGAEPADVALSSYGLLELADMSRISTMVDEELLRRTSRWVLSQRSAKGVWVKVLRDEWDRTKEVDAPLLTAYAGWALATAASLEKTPDPKVGEVLDRVGALEGEEAEDPYGLALRMNALLAGGRTDAAKKLGERLAARAIKGDDGVHWTSKASGVLYSYGASLDIETTGLATHALALAGTSPDLRSGALDWLVRRRSPRGTWSTTQATIAAMRALLDEARPVPKEPQDVALFVDGAPAGNVRLEPSARDVHHLVDLRRFATTGSHTIELKSAGDADVSYQLVSTHWRPWKAPERGALGLEVAYAPAAVAPGTTTLLRARLTWSGKLPAVMPLVEIPIPPSFEVETDDLEAILKASAGTHSNSTGIQRYTVSEGKLTLYLTSIQADRPMSIGVRLRALRTARVVAPASVAYLYYEPEVRTETAPVLVRAL